MPNYIHTLEAQVREAQAAQEALSLRFLQMREHLALPKYTQPAADGSRTDWISTADVARWLRYLEHGDHS